MPKREIIVPFFQLGIARGNEIGLERPFEEFDFRHLKLLTGEELIVARSSPGFSVGSTLTEILNNDAGDNRILSIDIDDKIALLQVYDASPRTEIGEDCCCYGNLVSKMNDVMISSRA